MPDPVRDTDEPDPKGATPRWVKLFAGALVLIIVVVVILHLTGNALGGHHLSLSAVSWVPSA